MKILEKHQNRPVILALGFFDSVHFGHRKILQTAQTLAKQSGCETAVFTFTNNMLTSFDKSAKLVYTYEERETILSELPIDYILPVDFDKEFMLTDKDSFLNRLFQDYHIEGIVCGYDYSFGSHKKGTPQYLAQFCKQRGVKCFIQQSIELEGVRVSSTLIRELIVKGEIEKANRYLCSPFFILNTVVHGRGVGRMFDMPTANIGIMPDKVLPKCGVYATTTQVDGTIYKSVTNVGSKPTFGEPSVSVETLLSDFNGDLYGKQIKVFFHKLLRDIQKFDSPTALKNAIDRDLLWNKN